MTRRHDYDALPDVSNIPCDHQVTFMLGDLGITSSMMSDKPDDMSFLIHLMGLN